MNFYKEKYTVEKLRSVSSRETIEEFTIKNWRSCLIIKDRNKLNCSTIRSNIFNLKARVEESGVLHNA